MSLSLNLYLLIEDNALSMLTVASLFTIIPKSWEIEYNPIRVGTVGKPVLVPQSPL